ncbi:MAG: divergent polysaccharide deacetylase family protein [Desulfobulbus sp.]|nr:divergent polysaccharide deacetylase family protein [Desulfobulbus sp.]
MPGSPFSHHLLQAFLVLAIILAPDALHFPESIGPVVVPPVKKTVTLAPGQIPPAPAQSVLSAEAVSPTSLKKSPSKSAQKKTTTLPKVAIIIDDMGYNWEAGLQLLHLDLQLNFSFLPQAPYTEEMARLAHQRGRTVLVHLPMEPKDHRWKEEPLTLHVGEGARQLREKTQSMVAAVPTSTGANNHMGSRLSEQQKEIRQVLATLKEQGLFFIDSSTSAASVAEATARQLGMPTARRRVFLDNDQQESAICSQLTLLVDLAVQEGEVIAIGHPNQGVVAAFTHCAPTILANVELVSAAQVVHLFRPERPITP